jgi:Flp pilus assembly protein TadD
MSAPRVAAVAMVVAVAAGVGPFLPGCAGRADADAVWARAEADLRADRIDGAERAVGLLERLREPTDLDRMLRGRVAVARRRPDRALAELALVADNSPAAAGARLLAGQLELRRNRFRYAERWLLEAARLDPKLVQAHRELIFIYGYQLRRAELGAEFLALSKLIDRGFQELFNWGLLRNDSWEPAEAARDLGECVAADPDDRWSRLALAEDERRLSLLDKAEATLAPLPADDPEAIAGRARIALDRGDAEAAGRLLAAGPPGDPALARLRGRLALARRDAAAAERQFRLALTVQPDNREAVSGLIAALKLRGDTRAIEPLRDILARLDRIQALIQRAGAPKERSDRELPILLGDACAALHRVEEARGWYKLAIARDPLDARAQRALFHLNESAKQPAPAAK